jgi:hypothetical protein
LVAEVYKLREIGKKTDKKRFPLYGGENIND